MTVGKPGLQRLASEGVAKQARKYLPLLRVNLGMFEGKSLHGADAIVKD